ncbi:MAG: hypothetical protein U1E33_02615 [Rhodospirillales bacterium]
MKLQASKPTLPTCGRNYLSNRVFGTYEAIVDACCAAWMALMNQPDKITSIATREWAKKVMP